MSIKLFFCLFLFLATQYSYGQASPEELTQAQQKLTKAQTLYSKEHIEYAKAAIDLAVLYYEDKGTKDQAYDWAIVAFKIIRKKNGAKDSLYTNSLAKLPKQQALLVDANLDIEEMEASDLRSTALHAQKLLKLSKACIANEIFDDAYYYTYDAYTMLATLPKEKSTPVYITIPQYLPPSFINFIEKQLEAEKALKTIPNSIELADILVTSAKEAINSEIYYIRKIHLDVAYLWLSEALSIYAHKLGKEHPKYKDAFETFTPNMKTFYPIEKDIEGRINRHETANDLFITDLRVYLKMIDNFRFLDYDTDEVFRLVLKDLKEHHAGSEVNYFIIIKDIQNTWDLSAEEKKIALQKGIINQIEMEFGKNEAYLEALINLANIEAVNGEEENAQENYNRAFDLADELEAALPFDNSSTQSLFEKYILKVVNPWKTLIIQERNLSVKKSVYGENSDEYLNAMFQAAWYYLKDYDFSEQGELVLFDGIKKLNDSNFYIATPWLDSLLLNDPVDISTTLIPVLPKTYPLVHLKELLKDPLDSIAKTFTPYSIPYNNALELIADGYFYSENTPRHGEEALLFYKKILNSYSNLEGKTLEYQLLLRRIIKNIASYNPWTTEETAFFFEELIKTLKQTQGADAMYIFYVKEYADWHYKGNRLISAESHYQLLINDYKERSAKQLESVEYIEASYHLARIYRKTGRYNKAISLYYSTVKSSSKTGQFVYIAKCFDDLGLIAYKKGQLEVATESFDNAMMALTTAELYDPKISRYNNFDLALLYTKIQRHIGRIHLDNGYIELAETFYKDIKEFERDERTPVSFKQDISLQSDLAYLYELKGDSIKAIRYYQSAIRQVKDQDELADVNLAFANFYQQQEKDSLAAIYFTDALNIDLNRIEKNYNNLAEKERLLFLNPISERLNAFFNFALPKQDSLLNLVALNAHLTVKGLALETSTNVQSICNETQNIVLKNQCFEMQSLRKILAQSTALPLREQENINAQIVALETRIGVSSKDLRAYFGKDNKKLNFYQLKQILKAVETEDSMALAIDFLVVDQVDDRGYEMAVYYAAVIGSSFEAPIFIRLATEEELEDVLAPDIAPNTINYITDELESRYLYQLVWEPLLPYVLKAKRLYLCPTGILSKIAFGTLRTSDYDQKRIMDDWSIHYHSSLRDLLNPQVEKLSAEATTTVGLVGGVKFTLTEQEFKNLAQRKNISKLDLEKALKKQSLAKSTLVASRNSRGEDFTYLPGTLEEVKEISNIFPEGWVINLLIDTLATEENLEIMANNSPSILHIATHGYFFPTPPKEEEEDQWSNSKKLATFEDKIANSSNPLLRSGLALAGINRVWKGGVEIEGLDDGILTALEVANMDLFNTNLVVLSACETGRGDIDNNEGIMGLRRAFKTAGAKQLLISLWKVPDQQTSELMQLFYKEYTNGKSAHEAFEKAQYIMQKRYKNPYYWAAFLLIE